MQKNINVAAQPSFSTSRINDEMFASSKLRRIKDREDRKAEKKKNLLSLKQSLLPFFEPTTRGRLSKCGRCNIDRENYNINFEWLLEPIDVLKESQKNFSISHEALRKVLSCIMRALTVAPAQIKIIKHLQEHKSNVPLVFVMKSSNLELDRCLLKFILKSFDLNAPEVISNEVAIRRALIEGKNILVSDESQLQAVFDFARENSIFWLPLSIAYEIQDSNPFSFTPHGIFRKMLTGYGLVKISLHEPYTFDDFFQRRDPDEEFARKHLYHDITFNAPVMASNLIAFLLLTFFNKGGKIEEMSVTVDEIRKEMNFVDFAFEGKSIDVIEHSLALLKEYITIDNEGIITPKEDKIEELKDYATTLLCHFALKSVILSTVAYLESIDPFVDYSKMMNYAADLCDGLAEKIPFRKCVSIQDQLNEAFDYLAIKDLLRRNTTIHTEKEIAAQKLAKYFDEENDDYENSYYDEYDTEEEELDPNNQVIINIDRQEEINVLKDIILLIQGNDKAEGDAEI